MTCIVAVKTEKGIHMAGDRMCSNGHMKITLKEPKVFIKGDFVIGITGSTRHLNLLKYSYAPSEMSADTTPVDYMCNAFVMDMKSLFEDEKDDEFQFPTLLIGYKGHLFYFESNAAIVEIDNHAVGSGWEIAVGALDVLLSGGISPEIAVARAVKTAAKYCATVDANVDVLFLENK